ncbi:MAG: DUF2953 domain-containing protein [Acutalibacteraceae bacterium]
MTALYIILGILLFILLLLSIPLKADIVYNGSWTVKIKYLFLSFKIVPAKEKKKNKSQPEKEENGKQKPKTEKTKNSNLSFVKEKGFSGLVALLKDIINLINQSSRQFLRHLLIYKMDINAAIAGEDSAQTAMNYGYACSAIYPAVSFIESHLKKCKYHLNITADFDSDKTVIDTHVILGIRPVFALHIAIKALIGAVKIVNKK